MKGKRALLVLAVALVLAAGGAAAYGFAIHEKQPDIDPTTGGLAVMIHEKQPDIDPTTGGLAVMKDEEAFIRSNAKPVSPGTLEVPVYRQQELLHAAGRGFFLGRDAGFYKDWLNTRLDNLGRTQALFPSNAMRQSEGGSQIYVMYDTEVGNRLYLFYPKEHPPLYPYWYQLGFPVLMAKKLSNDDFAALRPGDNMDKVEAIDSVVTEYRHTFDLANDIALENYSKMGCPPTSVHLLSDGILKIEYARVAGGDYTITSLTYRPDFVLDGLDGATCYRIAEVDYVK